MLILKMEYIEYVMRNILSLKNSYKKMYIKSLEEISRGVNAGFNCKNSMGEIVTLFRRTYVLKLVITLTIQNLSRNILIIYSLDKNKSITCGNYTISTTVIKDQNIDFN